jgi:C4-dicarboxylate transporter DctQ subunit
MRLIVQVACFVDRWLERAMLVALCTTLVVALSYAAFVRYFVPIPFFTAFTAKAEEIAIFAFTGLLYVGAALATRERGHFRVYAHFLLLPKAWQRWAYIPGDIVWLTFNVFVIWQGAILVKSAVDNPEASLSLQIPMQYIYAIIPLSFLLMSVRLVQSYFRKERQSTETPMTQL